MSEAGQSPADRTVAAWRNAFTRGDDEAAQRCLSADVILISPLTARFCFHGPQQVGQVLTAAFDIITDIRFHTEVGDEATRALFFRGRVGVHDLEEAHLLRLDVEGLVREITLFGRPLPALTAVMHKIGPRLLRSQGQPRLAPAISAATAPLAALTSLGERYLVPLADPARRPS